MSVESRRAARSLAIIAAALLAFWPTWKYIVSATWTGGDVGYYPLFILLVVLAAIGMARQPRHTLPISDRQANAIAGTLGIAVAALIKLLVVPRYAEQYALLQIDLLAALVFVLSATVLLFGLRQVGTYWPLWLVLIIGGPLAYRLLVSLLGGDARAAGTASILVCSSAIALGLGHRARDRVAIYGLAVVLGSASLAVLLELAPGLGLVQFQRLPVVVGGLATWLIVRIRRRGAIARAPSPSAPSGGESSWRSVTTLGLAAGLVAVIPLPASVQEAVGRGPDRAARITQTVPAGWGEESRVEYTWVRRYFGPEATLGRQLLRAAPGNAEIASLGLGAPSSGTIAALLDAEMSGKEAPTPRVAVDTFSLPNRVQLDIYPVSTLYDLGGTRRSNPVMVDLGHGVAGMLYTVIDEQQYLTQTRLVFSWQRGESVQRVVLTTQDNREAGARVPEPQPSMASNLTVLLEIFFRGNDALTDSEPALKDARLITTFARQLVAAQFQGH
ncbi:hypothetical protein HT102_01390 [Hoyosella sp. G463]|uniref:Uncharacterized protein n=1 Tax=Lolliginicoccus lacisalsi TaxID=2742202 RepID=A0A927PKU0_9ACTN|nr:hypothetical protein [Lolliginicoccus lacisalsi]MBD8505144.1 hypothetical protein [Lolliginicoccus lacisalsi]